MSSSSSSSSTSSSTSSNTSSSGLLATLMINATLFLALFLIFVLVRQIRLTSYRLNFRRFFSPRSFQPELEAPDVRKELSVFTHLILAVLYSNDKLVISHGVDAVMHVYFVMACLAMMSMAAVLNIGVLLPLYISEGSTSNVDEDNVDALTQFTIASLPAESNLRQVAYFMVAVLTFLVCVTCFFVWRKFLTLRDRFFGLRHPRSFTVMVEDIPSAMCRAQDLRRWFSHHYPTPVVELEIAYQAKLQRKLFKQRRQWINRLEAACDAYENDPSTVPEATVGVGCVRRYLCCPCGSKGEDINVIEHSVVEIRRLEQQLMDIRLQPEKYLQPAHVAFVTFASTFPARAQVYPAMDVTGMKISAAPDPQDVSHNHLHISSTSSWIRLCFLTLLTLLLILVWAPMSLLFLSIANLSSLSSYEGLTWLDDVVLSVLPEVAVSTIETYLPGLLLSLLTLLVNPVFRLVFGFFGGFHRKSDADRWVTIATYLFLFVNVYLLAAVGSSVFTFIETLNSLEDLNSALSQAMTRQSSYFFSYVLSLISTGALSKLFRPGDLILQHIALTRAKTRRQREWAMYGKHYDKTKTYATDLMVFLVCLTYSIVNPLIILLGVAYYVVALYVHKYNILYVHVYKYESGGIIWGPLFHGLMIALVVFQLWMIVISGISIVTIRTVLAMELVLLALPPLTLIYWVWMTQSYGRASQLGSVVAGSSMVPAFPGEFRGAYAAKYSRELSYFDDRWNRRRYAAADIIYDEERFRNFPPLPLLDVWADQEAHMLDDDALNTFYERDLLASPTTNG